VSTNDLAEMLSGPGKREVPEHMRPRRARLCWSTRGALFAGPGGAFFHGEFYEQPDWRLAGPERAPFGRMKFLVVRKNGSASALPLRIWATRMRSARLFSLSLSGALA